MNSPRFDIHSSGQFSSDSSFFYDDNIHENGSIFSDFHMIDNINNDFSSNSWFLDDKYAPILPTPQRKKKQKHSNDSISHEFSQSVEQLITKKNNHLKQKYDLFLSVDTELPDNILASPYSSEDTQDEEDTQIEKRNAFSEFVNSSCSSSTPPLDDNPITSFDDILKKVKLEMDSKKHDDVVTSECDVEYLEKLLAGIADESVLRVLLGEKQRPNEDVAVLNGAANTAVLLPEEDSKGLLSIKKECVALSNDLSADNGRISDGAQENLPLVSFTARGCDENLISKDNNTTEKDASAEKKVHLSAKTHEKKSKKKKHKSKGDKKRRKDKAKATIAETVAVAPVPVEDAFQIHASDFEDAAVASSIEVQETFKFDSDDNMSDFGDSDKPSAKKCVPVANPANANNVTVTKDANPGPTKKKLSFEEYLKKRAATRQSIAIGISTAVAATSRPPSETKNETKIKVEGASFAPCTTKTMGGTVAVEAKKMSMVKVEETEVKQVMKQRLEPSPVMTKIANGAEFKAEKVARKTSSSTVTMCSPDERLQQAFDNCDQYSTSGISSYQNSSVSSLCGSPSDEKSNDTKYAENDNSDERKATSSTNLILKESPFALNMELLRKKDSHNSRKKHKHKKRKKSDSSSYGYGSDCSDFEDEDRHRSRRKKSCSSSSKYSKYTTTDSTSTQATATDFYNYNCGWNYMQPPPLPLVPLPHHPPPPAEMAYFNGCYYPAPAIPPPPPMWPPQPEFTYMPPPFPPNPTEYHHPYYYDKPYFNNKNYYQNERCVRMAAEEEACKQRRVLFVGNIEAELTQTEFRKRFAKFGTVEHVKLMFKGNGNGYGFITYTKAEDVLKAVEHGNDDPDLPKYTYGFGGRKINSGKAYNDLDGSYYPYENVGYSVPNYVSKTNNHNSNSNSFDIMLKEFKNELQQKKLNDAQFTKNK